MFFISFPLLVINYLLFAHAAFAQCPVCVVTVGGGMLIAKKLGIDDLLVSIWISALNTAIAFWLAPKFKLKLLRNSYFLSSLFLSFTLFYFKFTDQIGLPSNTILGIDKIFLGQITGLLSMFLGNFLYTFSKVKNHHRALFPYSKVVIPVSVVLVITLIFKFIFKLN